MQAWAPVNGGVGETLPGLKKIIKLFKTIFDDFENKNNIKRHKKINTKSKVNANIFLQVTGATNVLNSIFIFVNAFKNYIK